MRPTDEFWRCLGIGLMVLFMGLGVGSCMLLSSVTRVSIPTG